MEPKEKTDAKEKKTDNDCERSDQHWSEKRTPGFKALLRKSGLDGAGGFGLRRGREKAGEKGSVRCVHCGSKS
jgi:hypothetical protein